MRGEGCRREASAVVVPLLIVSAVGCRKPSAQDDHAPVDVPATLGAEDAGRPETRPRVLAARCPREGRAIVLGDAGAQADFEIGDTLAYAGGYAVGFSRRSGRADGARVAAAALLGPEAAGPARIVELGPAAADALTPVLARRSGDWLAAFFVAAPGGRLGKRRDLAIHAFAADGTASQLAAIPQQSDDSMASDMASDGQNAFVVWDEAPSARRGVIRGAYVDDHGSAGAPHAVSPADSDAEVPRIFWSGAAYVALWMARGVDDSPGGDASEVTGEARSSGWLQGVELDPPGTARGPVRDLTPRGGHVSSYDARMLTDGALLIVARDDGEANDAPGGTLLRTRVRGGVAEPVQRLPVDGLGRGAPLLLEGRPPWLTWVGHDEQVRMLPLDVAGAPDGLASSEDALAEARPLAAVPSRPSGPARWLMASPSDPAGPLRTVDCAPAAPREGP